MDYIFIGVLFLISLWYLYRTFFKKKGCASCPTTTDESNVGCGCGTASCGSVKDGK